MKVLVTVKRIVEKIVGSEVTIRSYLALVKMGKHGPNQKDLEIESDHAAAGETLNLVLATGKPMKEDERRRVARTKSSIVPATMELHGNLKKKMPKNFRIWDFRLFS